MNISENPQRIVAHKNNLARMDLRLSRESYSNQTDSALNITAQTDLRLLVPDRATLGPARTQAVARKSADIAFALNYDLLSIGLRDGVHLNCDAGIVKVDAYVRALRNPQLVGELVQAPFILALSVDPNNPQAQYRAHLNFREFSGPSGQKDDYAQMICIDAIQRGRGDQAIVKNAMRITTEQNLPSSHPERQVALQESRLIEQANTQIARFEDIMECSMPEALFFLTMALARSFGVNGILAVDDSMQSMKTYYSRVNPDVIFTPRNWVWQKAGLHAPNPHSPAYWVDPYLQRYSRRLVSPAEAVLAYCRTDVSLPREISGRVTHAPPLKASAQLFAAYEQRIALAQK